MAERATLEVPKQLIEEVLQGQLAIAMMEVIKRDGGKTMIEAIVKQALTEKANSYNTQTIWQGKMNEMLRQEALAAAQAWIEEQRPAIRKAVAEHMGKNTQGFVKQIAEKLAAQVGSFDVSFHFLDRER